MVLSAAYAVSSEGIWKLQSVLDAFEFISFEGSCSFLQRWKLQLPSEMDAFEFINCWNIFSILVFEMEGPRGIRRIIINCRELTSRSLRMSLKVLPPNGWFVVVPSDLEQYLKHTLHLSTKFEDIHCISLKRFEAILSRIDLK